jgi:hypothetical protein
VDNDANPAEGLAQRLEAVYTQLAQTLRRPDVMERLNAPASEAEWSAMQVVGHMIEMIPYWLLHARMLIAAPGEPGAQPPAFGRSLDAPERLEGVARGEAGSLDELLPGLQAEIRAAQDAIRAMTPADRAKKGVHIRRGEMTVDEVLETLIVAHAEDHLAQVRTALGVQGLNTT